MGVIKNLCFPSFRDTPLPYFKVKKTDGRKGRLFQLPPYFRFLLSKVGPDLLHTLALCHMKGTAGIAVAAGDTIAGGLF